MGRCVAGVDWASEEHACCVLGSDGRIVEGRRYRHDERGIGNLCRRLSGLRVELVAVERPDGLLIERLLDAGLPVIAIHPNQVAAMRPRFSAAGGKSDSFDSFGLAELARSDSHRYRVLVPDGDATKALRALTRAREDLVQTRCALANELRAQLACFWPGALHLLVEIDSPIARSRSSSAIPVSTTRVVWGSSGWHGSWRARRIPDLARRRSCSNVYVARPRAALKRWSPKPAARSCSLW